MVACTQQGKKECAPNIVPVVVYEIKPISLSSNVERKRYQKNRLTKQDLKYLELKQWKLSVLG